MVKIGARIVRSVFIGNLIGILMFILLYLGMVCINSVGGTTIMKPVMAGLFGYISGISASVGIELSKDIQEGE